MKVGKWCSVGLNELPDYPRLAPLMSSLPGCCWEELSSDSPQAESCQLFPELKSLKLGLFPPSACADLFLPNLQTQQKRQGQNLERDFWPSMMIP